MKRALTYIAFAILGLGIGAYTALAMSGLLPGDRRTQGPVAIGNWYGDLAMGSENASPYFLARIARHGLLALANTKAIYFTRITDDSGRPLTEACDYRLSGGAMPARWWSVTLYNSDNFLPDNSDGALSFDASRAAQQSGDGSWSAVISPSRPSGETGWLSSKAGGEFDLTFRLYVPDDGVLGDPAGMIDAPSVTRIGCEGEAS